MIRKKIFAVLVSDGSRSFMILRSLLKTLGVEVWSAYTCAEAARLVEQTHPELIFTSTELTDGTWNENVLLAENAAVPTNAIVVGKDSDVGLRVSTVDRGAFDFIVPPFEADALDYLVHVAAANVRLQREIQAAQTAA